VKCCCSLLLRLVTCPFFFFFHFLELICFILRVVLFCFSIDHEYHDIIKDMDISYYDAFNDGDSINRESNH
jgi:hypothetical protein